MADLEHGVLGLGRGFGFFVLSPGPTGVLDRGYAPRHAPSPAAERVPRRVHHLYLPVSWVFTLLYHGETNLLGG